VKRVTVILDAGKYWCEIMPLRNAMRRELPFDGYTGYMWNAVLQWGMWDSELTENPVPVLNHELTPDPYEVVYLPDMHCLYYCGVMTDQDWHLRNQSLPDFTPSDVHTMMAAEPDRRRFIGNQLALIRKELCSTASLDTEDAIESESVMSNES